MFKSIFAAALCAVGVICAAAAAERPAVADPATPAKPLQYESAFAKYQRYEEPALRSWTEVNDEVAKAGGHIGIFRGTDQPAHGQAPVRGAPQAPGGKHAH